VIAIQEAGFVTPHEQLGVVVTATVPLAALAVQVALVGVIVNAQVPAWSTTNVWVPIETDPDRGVVELFAAME
jgi:hypothetical protein